MDWHLTRRERGAARDSGFPPLGHLSEVAQIIGRHLLQASVALGHRQSGGTRAPVGAAPVGAAPVGAGCNRDGATGVRIDRVPDIPHRRMGSAHRQCLLFT